MSSLVMELASLSSEQSFGDLLCRMRSMYVRNAPEMLSVDVVLLARDDVEDIVANGCTAFKTIMDSSCTLIYISNVFLEQYTDDVAIFILGRSADIAEAIHDLYLLVDTFDSIV